MRGLQRYLWRLRGFTVLEERVPPDGPRQPADVDLMRRAFVLRYWSEESHEKEALLGGVMEFLIPRKYLIAVDPGWNRWDLEIFRGIWAKARVAVATENHGGTKRLLNVRSRAAPDAGVAARARVLRHPGRRGAHLRDSRGDGRRHRARRSSTWA